MSSPETAAPERVEEGTAASLSDAAERLARDIETALSRGEPNALSAHALQELQGAICRIYSVQAENGASHLPLPLRTSVSNTDIMTMASGLLKAANLAVFELGMWQSWTGR